MNRATLFGKKLTAVNMLQVARLTAVNTKKAGQAPCNFNHPVKNNNLAPAPL